jgi:hypothetical protein
MHSTRIFDAAPPAHDIVDAGRRHIQGLRQRVGAHAERNQIVLPQDFAGMHRPHAVLEHGNSPSVIVYDLDVFRPALRPAETHAELIKQAQRPAPWPA